MTERAEHTAFTPGPWKRYNAKGSVHATRRMSELRDRKTQVRKSDAIVAWSQATGIAAREWWDRAQAAGLTRASSDLERIHWLETQARATGEA